MILFILKSYFSLFLSVGIVCLSIFLIGLYFILRPTHQNAEKVTDLTAIAGDDIVTTQLDLARAYIEINNRALAKEILKKVLQEGSKAQKTEAKALLSLT